MTTPIADARDKLAHINAQIADARAQLERHQAEAAQIDQSLAGATLRDKPLDLVIARERRAQLAHEIRKLTSTLAMLEQERDTAMHSASAMESKLKLAHAVLHALRTTGLHDREIRRMPVGDLLQKIERARAAFAQAGEPVPGPITIEV